PDVVEKYASGQIERDLGISYSEYKAAGNGYNYFLQPVTDIHLHSNLQSEIKPNGSIVYVYIFISIAVLILIIACINFVNLATARSAERAREVGVRKVMGSDRGQLIRQFLAESVFISLISLVMAVSIIQIILPAFNVLADKELVIDLFGSAFIGPALLIFAIIVGLLAGIYPAFYISSMKLVEVMKGKFQSNSKGRWLRNGLVIFQFGISIILISGTLVVSNQMDYIRNKKLGFDKENILVVENFNNLQQPEAFKQQVKNLAAVRNLGATGTMPGDNFFGIQFRQPGDQDILTTKGLTVDDYFIETMGIKLLEGESFKEGIDDSLHIILNESAVRALGIENPVGATLNSTRNVDNEQVTLSFTVIGIAENFNFESLRTDITPLAILSSESAIGFENFLTVRVGAGASFNETIDQVESMWASMLPDRPFSYTFLDSDLEKMYESEQVSAKIFAIFSILAIIIACIGLFGLAAYTAYQRTKEIGVRKVLGASVPSIVLLLSKDFTRLVGWAFLIAAPVAYLIMENWLQNFAFRIELGLTIFLASGLIALMVALVTVSFQAISAALTNPVNSLRSE
ncbi:MAG: FtsX-like permease family protein, partial [Candidatus Halalkalibacterium sp. M3_1C_030]